MGEVNFIATARNRRRGLDLPDNPNQLRDIKYLKRMFWKSNQFTALFRATGSANGNGCSMT